MQIIAMESVSRLALKRGEAEVAVGGSGLFRDLIDHCGLKPVKQTRKESHYSVEAIERALKLAEATGVLIEGRKDERNEKGGRDAA